MRIWGQRIMDFLSHYQWPPMFIYQIPRDKKIHPCTNSKKPFNEWNNFSLQSIFLQSSDCDIDILLGVIKSLPYLEKLAVWTSAEHLPPMKGDLLSKLQCLEMDALNHESLLKYLCLCLKSHHSKAGDHSL